MIEAERIIFRKFLEQRRPQYDYHKQEVLLIIPSIEQPPATDPIENIWQRLTAPRIDAICIRGSQIDLVEVKEALSWQALAQITLYRELWRTLRTHTPIARCVIATSYTRDDIERTALTLGIEVAQVNAGNS